jgi:predicted secreted protein
MRSTITHRVLLLSRRAMLCRLGTAGILAVLWPVSAWTTPEAVQQAIRQRIGIREPQPEDHVLRLHVFVPGNPEPVAATYHLGVWAGKAEISTRIRLARSQMVLALAEMSDGSVRSEAASIVVTLGACVEEIWSN